MRRFFRGPYIPIALLLLLGACVPRVEGAGPPRVVSALDGAAIVAADGARLPLRIWRAEGRTRAVIVALHGFNDYGEAFDAPARDWARRGITTYAYDQRGFGATATRGLWPGTGALVSDLAEALRLVRAANPGAPLVVVGESMGGAVAMVYAARAHSPPIDGLVLAAPAVWGWRSMSLLYRASLWLSAHVTPWAHVTGRGLGIKPSDNRKMLIALGKDPLIIKETRIDAVYGLVGLMSAAFDAAGRIATPTLVLYGENDQLIPKTPTFAMLARLETPHRVAIYPEGYHMLLRDLDAAIVRADIAAWVLDPGRPLPSGFERKTLPTPRTAGVCVAPGFD